MVPTNVQLRAAPVTCCVRASLHHLPWACYLCRALGANQPFFMFLFVSSVFIASIQVICRPWLRASPESLSDSALLQSGIGLVASCCITTAPSLWRSFSTQHSISKKNLLKSGPATVVPATPAAHASETSGEHTISLQEQQRRGVDIRSALEQATAALRTLEGVFMPARVNAGGGASGGSHLRQRSAVEMTAVPASHQPGVSASAPHLSAPQQSIEAPAGTE